MIYDSLVWATLVPVDYSIVQIKIHKVCSSACDNVLTWPNVSKDVGDYTLDRVAFSVRDATRWVLEPNRRLQDTLQRRFGW